MKDTYMDSTLRLASICGLLVFLGVTGVHSNASAGPTELAASKQTPQAATPQYQDKRLELSKERERIRREFVRLGAPSIDLSFRAALDAMPRENAAGTDMDGVILTYLRQSFQTRARHMEMLDFLKARILDDKFSTGYAYFYGSLLIEWPSLQDIGAAYLAYAWFVTRLDAARCGSKTELAEMRNRRQNYAQALQKASNVLRGMVDDERNDIEVFWKELETRTAAFRRDIPLCRSGLEYFNLDGPKEPCSEEMQAETFGNCVVVGDDGAVETKWAPESEWQAARDSFHKSFDDGSLMASAIRTN